MLWTKLFYICKQCDARVGCHKNGQPMGTPANAELRKARMAAHKVFDEIWRSGAMSRKKAYKLLSKKFGVKEFHIGESTLEEATYVIGYTKEIKKDLGL